MPIAIDFSLKNNFSIASTRPENTSDSKKAPNIFSDHGYTFLKHKTQLEKVVSILKSGYLFTGDKVPFKETGVGLGGNRSGMVFFDPTKHTKSPDSISFHSFSYSCWNKEESGDLAAVTLIFKLNVLDQAKYHVSSYGWSRYGHFESNRDYRYDMDPEKLHECLKSYSGEVVFYHDVSIAQLAGIWVHPSKTAQIIDYLKSHQITTINQIPVEKFFQEPALQSPGE